MPLDASDAGYLWDMLEAARGVGSVTLPAASTPYADTA
jgi:hypothetical protein